MIAITGTKRETLAVSYRALAAAVKYVAWEMCGKPDDPGVDWHTTMGGVTYLGGDETWVVSTDRRVARLIDAANVLWACQAD